MVSRTQRPYLTLAGLMVFLAAGFIVYSQTKSFAWDEGFHLLAAQLIKHGKTPYLDFAFPQTPLNAFWNAGWMGILGESWHAVHLVAAVMVVLAILLTAGFVFTRFFNSDWRLTAAVTAALLFGLNWAVVEYGTVGQAYGLALFLIVAAFRVAILAVDSGLLLALAAGFLASAAAGCTQLTAPVTPLLLLWIMIYNRRGNRWMKFAVYCAGVVLAMLPVIYLFIKGPKQTFFNLIAYNLFYRQVEWEGAIAHDIGVFTAWIDASQALILGLLALVGLLYVRSRGDWNRSERAPYYLCAWLALGEMIHISSAHPTFQRYYMFTVPFLAILATVGLYAVGSRLDPSGSPWRPALSLILLVSLGLGKSMFEDRDSFVWADLERLASKVDQVTPPGAPLVADEQIYFLTRRTPPSGMELDDSHKLNLSPTEAALFHVVSRPELGRRIHAGEFTTVEQCEDHDTYDKLGLPQLYRKNADVENCTVFWDFGPTHVAKPPADPLKQP